MPTAPKHACSHPGCAALLDKGQGSRCPKHQLPEQDRGTRQERGYTAEFYRIVKELIAAGHGCMYAHRGPCSGPLTGEHIIPLSRGGRTERGNIGIACRHHNSSRGNR